MVTIQSHIHVDHLKGSEITDFLLTCTDHMYRAWWPGTHLEFHTITRRPNNVGNVVFMDEFIGKRRVRMTGIVKAVEPSKKIVWQLKKRVPLPVYLTLDLVDDAAGVSITHTMQAGLSCFGRVLDPLFRLYFSTAFACALDEHVKTEFPKLRELLHGGSADYVLSAG